MLDDKHLLQMCLWSRDSLPFSPSVLTVNSVPSTRRPSFGGTGRPKMHPSTACWRSSTTSRWRAPTPCGRRVRPASTRLGLAPSPWEGVIPPLPRRMDSTTTTPATHVTWTRPAGTFYWIPGSPASPSTGTGLLGGTIDSPSRMATRISSVAPSTRTPCLRSQTMASSPQTTTPTWRAKGAPRTRWPPRWGAEWAPVGTTALRWGARPARTTGTRQWARRPAPPSTASRSPTQTASGATAACGTNTTSGPRVPTWPRPVPRQPSDRGRAQDPACRSKWSPMWPGALSRTPPRLIHTAPTPTPASLRVWLTLRPQPR